jgi:PTS system N-acetylglucosamine-specific IIC component
MMKYMQRLGKSLMLPVACLPVAGILLGIGNYVNAYFPSHVIATFLIKAGGALIDNMAILFVLGVAIGMSEDGEGTSALAGMVSYLVIKTLLDPAAVAVFSKIELDAVDEAFSKVASNQFIGIIAGLIGASCYNKFHRTKLPDALSFFSGRRCVAIVTAGVSLVASLILFFIWPTVYGALVSFGEMISSTKEIGVGLYGFFNRLLIPVGLHHALNSVFWFDAIGIADLNRFWGLGGYDAAKDIVQGQTGQYMTGFFPVMMFGIPAAALAMIHTAKPEKKKVAIGLLGSAAVCSFLTGVTEPLEFAFMFTAPALYVVHAALMGIVCFICAYLPVRAGFTFSGGTIDLILCSKMPSALNTWMIIPIGLVVAVVYYTTFRFAIVKFNFKTPGREDDDQESEKTVTLANNDFTKVAAIILEGLGGKENIKSLDNCVTRLRMGIKDQSKVDDKKIKSAGIAGILKPSKDAVQVIVGTKVQFVADEMKKML